LPVSVLLQRHEIGPFHKAPKCGVETRVGKAFSQIPYQHDLGGISSEPRLAKIFV
jgi:hypothetical protein